MHHVLTIAGSDSGGGAGIQADLKTFAAHGVYGTSAITAVTAQNTERVTDVHVLPAGMVAAQIDAVASDIRIDAVKTGMLADAAIVEIVAAALVRWRLPHLVVDPVMIAKSGDHLLESAAAVALREVLLPLATVVTPNREEAEVLAGRPVTTIEDARDAARRITDAGCGAVVIKGGHFEGTRLVNLLFDGHDFTEVVTERVRTRNTHGTGCTFAAALAAQLARGRSLTEAVQDATEYVAGAIAHAAPVGHGHGPVNHFWRQGMNG
jgi:hydroxymethylpyrimidine/phosphomethylpyrimidine kinase